MIKNDRYINIDRKSLRVTKLPFKVWFSPVFTSWKLIQTPDHQIVQFESEIVHDDVIKWKHFPRSGHFMWGIHLSPMNSPHKRQWRGALMFSFICAWINGWVNNREARDLRRHRTHHDVTVMFADIWSDPYLMYRYCVETMRVIHLNCNIPFRQPELGVHWRRRGTPDIDEHNMEGKGD